MNRLLSMTALAITAGLCLSACGGSKSSPSGVKSACIAAYSDKEAKQIAKESNISVGSVTKARGECCTQTAKATESLSADAREFVTLTFRPENADKKSGEKMVAAYNALKAKDPAMLERASEAKGTFMRCLSEKLDAERAK